MMGREKMGREFLLLSACTVEAKMVTIKGEREATFLGKRLDRGRAGNPDKSRKEVG